MSKKAAILTRLAKTSQVALLVGASLYVLVYLVIAAMRLPYPFELENMEGGSVVQVQRILDGQPLYVRPSLDYIPALYSPLYYYVSAPFAAVLGNGFLPLRLVSFLASVGCFILIFLVVHRRTSSWFASFVASCLFAATFRVAGAWFDIARVDSLSLFLLLAGVYAYDSSQTPIRSFVSPLLLFLSFFTKQSGLMVGLSLSGAAILTRKGRERFLFPLVFGLLVVGSSLVMNALSGGWYDYYVFGLSARHAIVKRLLIDFWAKDVAGTLAIALCFCLVPLVNVGGKHSRPDVAAADILLLGGLLLMSYPSRVKVGGYTNVLMPAYAGIAVYFGIGFAWALERIGGVAGAKTLLVLSAILQFASLLYWPQQQVPSPRDRRQGERLEQLICSFKGEVYLSSHPWYLAMAGKRTQAQAVALWDVLRASGPTQWEQTLEQEMASAVAKERYDAFIVDYEPFLLRPADFDTHYELVESNLSGSAFHVVTGWDSRPTYLYVRRTVQAAALSSGN